MNTIRKINYGNLSPLEQDENGHTYFGSGNLATGWHATQAWDEPLPFINFLRGFFGMEPELPELTHSVGLKVHLRQGADIAPDNSSGDHYTVPAGAQPGNDDRAAWNVDFSFLDVNEDFGRATIKIDLDPTAGKDFLTFRYNEDHDVFVAKDDNGNLRFIETGNGPDNVLQDSVNLMFFADLIDNDGDASNGIQEWDMSHGQFDFEASQYVPGILGSAFGAQLIKSSVTVTVDDTVA